MFSMGLPTTILLLIVWGLPVVFILRDSRIELIERILWLVAVFVFSWFSFLLFLWIAPLFGRPEGVTENPEHFDQARNILDKGTRAAAIVAFVVGVVMIAATFVFLQSNALPAFLIVIPLMIGGLLLIPAPIMFVAVFAKRQLKPDD